MVPYIHGRILAKLIPQEYFYDFLTIDNADHNNIFKIKKELIYKTIRKFIEDCTGISLNFTKLKEIREKHYSDDFGNNQKQEKDSSKSSNFNNSEKNKLNKSSELKKPTINLIPNNYPNINKNPSSFNELNMLINNSKLNNLNILKNTYPSYNFYNTNTNIKSEIFKRYSNDINRLPDLSKIIEGSYNNNNILNINNIQDNGVSTKILNENHLANSTLNNLNNSK